MNKKMIRINDMTVGDPIKLILMFAIPLFIGNVFQQIYSIADTVIIGHNLGDVGIASIGVTTSIYSLLINFASGLNSGYGIIVGQSFGAKNEDKLRKSIATMIILNLIITAILTILSLVFLRSFMEMMNVPANIFDDAYSYISIILAGMLVTISYNMFAGIMRAVGNSRTPLYFLILSCAINIALDILFITVFGWGVAGAAIATVVAQACSALFSGIYVFSKYRDILPTKKDFHFEKLLVVEMSTTGFSMAMMLCVVDIGTVIYQRAINGLGETLIVSHTAARRIIGIFGMLLGSIATANSTFVSQNWGANKKQRINGALKQVIILEIAWGIFSSLIVFLFGGYIVQMLTGTSNTEVINNAVLSIRLHSICFPALGTLLALRTTLQAIGYKIAPVISSMFELGIKLVAGMWVIPMFGFIIVCLAEPVIWTVCAIYLVITFAVLKPFSSNKKE